MVKESIRYNYTQIEKLKQEYDAMRKSFVEACRDATHSSSVNLFVHGHDSEGNQPEGFPCIDAQPDYGFIDVCFGPWADRSQMFLKQLTARRVKAKLEKYDVPADLKNYHPNQQGGRDSEKFVVSVKIKDEEDLKHFKEAYQLAYDVKLGLQRN